ncbi:hypothetical protein ACFQ2M_35575 [Kitasatospora saccharophila]|uniref:hypothetical protein n=1 Tax=Kitasatospora saccharophila TaxID=407973 RepID=UPI00362FB79B
MTDPAPQDPLPAEDDGVLDPADSLEVDDLDEDPLETGIVTADGYRGATGYGTTAAEAAAGSRWTGCSPRRSPTRRTRTSTTAGPAARGRGPGGWWRRGRTCSPRTPARTAARPGPRRRPST